MSEVIKDERAASPAATEAALRLTPDVEWISECFPLRERHEHVSLYLIRHEGHFIVVDSGSFLHRESIEAKLRAATSGCGIDTLILSHSDYPHSGNISSFRSRWGDFEIFASCGDPEIQGLPYATPCRIGGSTDVLGRTFSFIDPPLADRSHTSWIYDHRSRVLFAADGFGSYHRPGECGKTSADFPSGIRSEDILGFHQDNIVWLRYVDPVKFRAKLDRMFSRFDVSYVAPIHGNPIAAADLPQYVERLAEAAEAIAAGYVVG